MRRALLAAIGLVCCSLGCSFSTAVRGLDAVVGIQGEEAPDWILERCVEGATCARLRLEKGLACLQEVPAAASRASDGCLPRLAAEDLKRGIELADRDGWPPEFAEGRSELVLMVGLAVESLQPNDAPTRADYAWLAERLGEPHRSYFRAREALLGIEAIAQGEPGRACRALRDFGVAVEGMTQEGASDPSFAFRRAALRAEVVREIDRCNVALDAELEGADGAEKGEIRVLAEGLVLVVTEDPARPCVGFALDADRVITATECLSAAGPIAVRTPAGLEVPALASCPGEEGVAVLDLVQPVSDVSTVRMLPGVPSYGTELFALTRDADGRVRKDGGEDCRVVWRRPHAASFGGRCFGGEAPPGTPVFWRESTSLAGVVATPPARTGTLAIVTVPGCVDTARASAPPWNDEGEPR